MAIDQLSHRLGSSSRTSVATWTSKSSSRSRHRHHHSSSSDASSTRRGDRPAQRSHRSTREVRAGSGHSSRQSERRDSPVPRAIEGGRRSHDRTTSSSSRTALQNRLSLATVSSGSTRLGEIPERRRRLRYTTTDSSSAEYNVAPVYPLRPYYLTKYEPKEKEKGFWGFFRRRP